jgi:alkylated DNA nucleotide flippase Atl1
VGGNVINMRKSWREKLELCKPPHVDITEKAFLGIPAGVKMLISSPTEVRDFVSSIPRGKCVSVGDLREALANRHRAKITCPLTTGIYLRIVAEAALDELESGKPIERITPFWRVISPKDTLAKKLRCGAEFVRARREEEGIVGV